MPNEDNDRKITFGGEIIPAVVYETPNIVRATRKMTVVAIPGSSRESIEMEDAYESYDQKYSFFVGDGTEDSIQAALDDVARIIYKTGYQVLLDDFEPDIYRLAYYQGGFEAANEQTRLGTFELSFKCRPERFLVTGDTPVTFTADGTIENPTAFDAKPLIRISGSGSGTVTIGETTMSFTGITDFLYIDCDRMDVYRGRTQNRNNLMTGEFPVLKPDVNVVSFTGGITEVKITPRWWVI